MYCWSLREFLQVTFTHWLRSSSVFAHCYCFHFDGLNDRCLFQSVEVIRREEDERHPEAMVLPLCQKTIAIKATLSESLRIDTKYLRLVKSLCVIWTRWLFDRRTSRVQYLFCNVEVCLYAVCCSNSFLRVLIIKSKRHVFIIIINIER